MSADEAVRTICSFSEISDPGLHRWYNEWHHLDHRPEYLRLPGVIGGERWVRTPDCAAASVANDPRFERFHYFNLYWLRGPMAESVEAWKDLGVRLFESGRRPDAGRVHRPCSGWGLPLKGYAAPRIRVPPTVVPLRPNLGIHLTVSEFRGAEAALDEVFGWYDTVRIPDLLECKGSAGIWTVRQDDSAPPMPPPPERRSLRFRITWLDADPLEHLADLAARESAWRAAGRLPDVSHVETVLFSGPLRLINPFQYDWFG